MSTVLTVLLALTPAAQEDASLQASSRLNAFFSSILPYRDGALFGIPYRFLPVVASLQSTQGNEDNPREQFVEEVSAYETVEDAVFLPRDRMGWVDELALDWGTAEIGPGYLHPQMYAVPFRPGGGMPVGGRGMPGNVFSQTIIPSPEPPGPGNPGGPGPGGGVEPVPEPSSILAWAVLMIGAVGWQVRRKRLLAA